MAGEPAKADINAIFKRLRSIPTNKQCFDCGAANPTWASVTYGVFLCIDCSAVHRSLGVHLTFIRSTQLDTSWTWLQLRAMQVGGNASATAFFRSHGCTTNDAQQKYNSRAAHMYRDKLHASAAKAMKIHGSKVHVDANTAASDDSLTSPPASTKEVDFFKEHEKIDAGGGDDTLQHVASRPMPVSNGSARVSQKPEDQGEGPSVEAALSVSPTQALSQAEPRKPTIGGRKPTSAKKGLGARKGGLGAQKVKANFNDIENAAVEKDKEKAAAAATLAQEQARSKEEQEKKAASMRLAYQDLSLESKKREERIKNMDPKKAQQMERLGMGSFSSKGVSHSALTDMTVISQEDPKGNREERFSSRTRDFDDDFELIGGSSFSSGPPKYSLKQEDRYSSWGNSGSNNRGSSWDAVDRFDSKQSNVIEDIPSAKGNDDYRGRSRKSYEVATSDEAQKKFGGAKAISSDMFFQKETDFETRQNLARFEGSASISSADFYGNGQPSSRTPTNDYYGSPDLQDIKDGVKQGVTKVAGKLSSLANGVMNSIQDNYG